MIILNVVISKLYVTIHSPLCLNMYHLAFRLLEQFVKSVNETGF